MSGRSAGRAGAGRGSCRCWKWRRSRGACCRARVLSASPGRRAPPRPPRTARRAAGRGAGRLSVRPWSPKKTAGEGPRRWSTPARPPSRGGDRRAGAVRAVPSGDSACAPRRVAEPLSARAEAAQQRADAGGADDAARTSRSPRTAASVSLLCPPSKSRVPHSIRTQTSARLSTKGRGLLGDMRRLRIRPAACRCGRASTATGRAPIQTPRRCPRPGEPEVEHLDLALRRP